jgi:hypothetical protein
MSHLLHYLSPLKRVLFFLSMTFNKQKTVIFLGDLTEHFGIHPYRKPTNASKRPLYCDVQSNAPTCFGVLTPSSGSSYDSHKLLICRRALQEESIR